MRATVMAPRRSWRGFGRQAVGLRRWNGSNAVAHRPRNITDIFQTDHFEIAVLARRAKSKFVCRHHSGLGDDMSESDEPSQVSTLGTAG
jgi:hypothetical protein